MLLFFFVYCEPDQLLAAVVHPNCSIADPELLNTQVQVGAAADRARRDCDKHRCTSACALHLRALHADDVHPQALHLQRAMVGQHGIFSRFGPHV